MKVEYISRQKTQNYYKRSDFEIRPVTKKDKWCRFFSRCEGELDTEAPYGYLVTVSEYFDGMELEIKGNIIKNRLFNGKLLLQIIKDERNNLYVIRLYSGKLSYLNIRNLKKVRPIQYY